MTALGWVIVTAQAPRPAQAPCQPAKLDEAACRDNVELLVKVAARHGNFVRVDMESSAYTTRTLDLVKDLHSRHSAVGTVIQA